MHDPVIKTTEGFRWFGQAIRDSWRDIDGRSIKSAINDYTDWVDEQPDELPFSVVARKAHDALNLCLIRDAASGEVHGAWEDSKWDEDCIFCDAARGSEQE